MSERRRKRRRYLRIACTILFFLCVGGMVYGLWQPAVRISEIDVQDADASLMDIAKTALQGTYFGIIPRDSTIFYPASRIHEEIIAAHPDIAAVSLFRNGLTGLSIKANYRVPIAHWCGTPADSTTSGNLIKEVIPTPYNECYLFDAGGFVYASATESFLSSDGMQQSLSESNPDKTLTPFILFDTFQDGTPSPIGATLKDADHVPTVFDFARQLESFGKSVASIVIHGDEVDFFMSTSTHSIASGLRITYLLGDEQNAYTALVSAKTQVNLTDPTLQYVDLRFPGKIYLKRAVSPK